MPLLCFDLIAGRSENQIKRILDVTHEVMVNAFNVPERDRYQIVREHSAIQNDPRGYGARHRANCEQDGPSGHDPTSQSGHEASVL